MEFRRVLFRSNIMAIACGVSDGLQLGNNARAALITRGLAEIQRIGAALGGEPETFMGLTGLGDLVLTATGDLSRNRQDRKSTRLNSSHVAISYAVFCLK